MKKRALVRHMQRSGCRQLRQGTKDEWWVNEISGDRTAVPRHTEIPNMLVKKICRDLGIAAP